MNGQGQKYTEERERVLLWEEKRRQRGGEENWPPAFDTWLHHWFAHALHFTVRRKVLQALCILRHIRPSARPSHSGIVSKRRGTRSSPSGSLVSLAF